MPREFFSALESRQLLSAVSAHIRLIGSDVIQAGQSISVDALATGTVAGSNFGTGGSAITSEIKWNFGDASGSFNRVVGFNAGHVYNKPGKYKLVLRVTNESGKTDTASRTITVKAAPKASIYVNPWGSDKNDGSTPDAAVATIGRAEQLLTDNSNLYFRSGQTFQTNSSINLPFSNVQIGAYGKGKSPSIQLMKGNNETSILTLGTDASNVSISNLLLEGNPKAPAFGEGIYAAGANITIKGIEFENLYTAIQASGTPRGLVVQNNDAGVLNGYFAYVRGSEQAYMGNIAGDSTAQHNIRIYGSRILCYGNDLTNLPQGSSLATLRVNDGSDIYWANNVLHGGQMLIGPLGPENPGAQESASVNTIVVEGNKWEDVPGHWSNHDRVEINPGVANIMIRNNIIDGTNATAISATTSQTQTFSTGTTVRTINNLQIVDNTDLNTGTTGAFLAVNGTENNSITLKNSLYVAPNMDIGPNTAAAVRVTGQNDLSNFTTLAEGGGISGNVWNLPAGAASEGVNYVGTGALGSTNYRTPTEWASDFPGIVSHDTFEGLLIDDLNRNDAPPKDSTASSFALPATGVFTDLQGDLRPDSDWTAGAIQVD
jgi:hypothetical protein